MSTYTNLQKSLCGCGHPAFVHLPDGIQVEGRCWGDEMKCTCKKHKGEVVSDALDRDAYKLAVLKSERDAYKRIIDDVRAGNYDNAHDITAARKYIFQELGKMLNKVEAK